jgi:hypothetical protein
MRDSALFVQSGRSVKLMGMSLGIRLNSHKWRGPCHFHTSSHPTSEVELQYNAPIYDYAQKNLSLHIDIILNTPWITPFSITHQYTPCLK